MIPNHGGLKPKCFSSKMQKYVIKLNCRDKTEIICGSIRTTAFTLSSNCLLVYINDMLKHLLNQHSLHLLLVYKGILLVLNLSHLFETNKVTSAEQVFGALPVTEGVSNVFG